MIGSGEAVAGNLERQRLRLLEHQLKRFALLAEIIGFVIEDSVEHSVVVYPHEGGYMLLGMWELDPHGFAQN